MAVAIALRGPHEAIAVLEKVQIVVQVDPGVTALLEKRARRAAIQVVDAQAQDLLITALKLKTELLAIGPGYARQVDVILSTQLDPAPLARRHSNDPQTQARVGPAGRRVALLDRRYAVSVDLAARDEVDGRFIDLDKRHVTLVRGPPVARKTVHLLLRDEFGHAVLDRTAAVVREAQLRPVAQVDGMDILVPDEGHVAPVGRTAHVGLEGFGIGELRNLLPGKIVAVHVAAQGKQERPRVLGPDVLHDAAPEDTLTLASRPFFVRQALRSGNQQLRVDEAARAPVTDVVFPEVVALVVVLPIAQEGDPAAIRRVFEGPRRGA